MKIVKLFLVLLFMTCSLGFAAYSIGDTVRNFTLNDCNGTAVNLYDYYWAENGGTPYVILINFGEPW